MAGIDLVVTDLDGTLWDADERIHDVTLTALRALAAREIPLLVATGRRRRSAGLTLLRSGLSLPMVLLDGAVGRVGMDGRVFHEAAFAPAAARRVLAAFGACGLEPVVHVDLPTVEAFAGTSPSTAPRHLDHIGAYLARDDLERVVAEERVFAFGMVGGDPERLLRVAAAVGDVAAATVTRDLLHGGGSIVVRPAGVSKWQGVEAWCADQGLDAGRVLAVGDGENDVELLTGAAIACVVRDGCEAALALADHVIEPAAVGGWSAILDHC